ncbi:MAG: DUF6498-containing protein [Bacteroidia bacterium]
MQRFKNILSDREFWFILVFNLCLAWGFMEGWLSMDTIVWIYFFQSVIIGISNTVRMGCLKNFSTDNFQVNGQSVEATSKTKRFSTLFFLVHYGFFHFGYFIFLSVGSVGNGSKLDFRMVLINIGIIAANALVSTWSTILQDRDEKPAISSLFFTPYLRVVPMHIFIIVGFTRKANPEILVPVLGTIHIFWVFLILKLVSDLLMHVVIQKTWRGPRVRPLGGYI